MKIVQLFCLSLSFAVLGAAQTASLRGHIFDPSGAAVPGATVVLTASDQSTLNATSGRDGAYSFGPLAPGLYLISASAPELATPQPIRVTLTGATTTLDLKLKIIEQHQDMQVGAENGTSVSIENTENASSVLIKGDDLNALADDPQDLQSDLQALAGPAAGPNGGSIYIDGFSGGQMPPKESIREVRINQNPFSPEYDKLGYGRVEVFTKPGASKWNGTLGFNYANEFWNSRNPYASAKAPLRLQEYENSFGGPLGHKTSFTMDLERHAVDNGSISNGVKLDPLTSAPQAFNSVHVTPQRHTLVDPHVDHQLTPADTVGARYNFTDASIQDAGVGAFDDTSRGYTLTNRFQTAQVSNTLARERWINECRFQFFHWAKSITPFGTSAAVQVLGAFTTGGATLGTSSDTQNNFEFQNYTSAIHRRHSVRFGVRLRQSFEDSISRNNFNGTFTFKSIESYRDTALGISGAGPSQFSITMGQPELQERQFDAGVFAGDEWKLQPNLTVSLGARYEAQTNIPDHSAIAPRAGIAWAPGRQRDGHTTVIRAGAGMFYDRFLLSDELTADRLNGIVQQQYVIAAPAFFPSLPDRATLANSTTPQIVWRKDGALRAPYIVQEAFSLEQQVTKTTAVAITYTNSHGVHQFRSQVLGAGTASPVFLMTSSGLYNQNQFIANVRTKPLPQVSLFGYYVLNHASSNTDGLSTFAANPNSEIGEYGPASTDVHHRFLIGGTLQLRGSIRINPYVMMQSGAPFNITTGQDNYGTTLFNSRPGIASQMGPGIVATKYGFLDPNPSNGEALLPRNFGRGPGQITVNLRVGKTIGIGPLKEKAARSTKSDAGPQINAANMAAPGGLRGLFAAPSSDRRYGFAISMSVRNLLNHNNPGPMIGNITSPLFAHANQLAGAPNMEGFMESASNRRLELQTKFIF